jgi:hypothetical protein
MTIFCFKYVEFGLPIKKNVKSKIFFQLKTHRLIKYLLQVVHHGVARDFYYQLSLSLS